MKVETRLLVGAVCAVIVFLWNWLGKQILDPYYPVVAFAVMYFLSPYIFNRTFFFGRQNEPEQKDDPDKKDSI